MTPAARRASPRPLAAVVLAVALAAGAAAGTASPAAAVPVEARADLQPVTITVTKDGRAVLGAPITYVVTVLDQAAGDPTGTVTLTRNGAVLGTGTLQPQGDAVAARIFVDSSSYAVGANALVASYSGDAAFAPARASVTTKVSSAPSKTTLALPRTAVPGQRAKATVTVTSPAASGPVMTGAVRVVVTSLSAGRRVVVLRRTGSGVVRLPRLPVGRYAVTAKALRSGSTPPSSDEGRLVVRRR